MAADWSDMKLYTAEQTRRLDAFAIENQGIPGIQLMRRAGRATLDALRAAWPEADELVVLCGAGNNGGDGYIVAGLARQKGMRVALHWLTDPQRLQGDARTAWLWAREEGVAMNAAEPGIDLLRIVDADVAQVAEAVTVGVVLTRVRDR